MKLAALAPAELAPLQAALTDADLPTADLAAPGRRFFRWGDAAFGGIEGEGPDVPLRSIVVARPGSGTGSALVEALAEQARRDGALPLWLLTADAAGFFAKRGFHRIERGEAPPAIQASEEFRFLCPASAVVMMRVLHPAP